MRSDNLFADDKPKTYAIGVLIDRPLNLAKHAEQATHLFLWNALPSVLDGNMKHLLCPIVSSDDSNGAMKCELLRVSQ